MRTSFYFSFLCFSLWLFLLLLSSCTTLEHGPLIDQELRFRPGYDGLTHATCLEFLDTGCIRQSVVSYSFQDPSTLKRLRDVRLICKVGERRFHVCPDKPALCSNFEEIKEFLGIPYTTKLVTEILYVPEDMKTLLDAGTYCAAQGSVSENGMF